jgi:hypothetical protein
MLRKAVAFIVIVLFAGSASGARDRASPAEVDVASALANGEGIVLVSTGAWSPYKTYLRVLAPKDDKEARDSARRLPALPVNTREFDSDFADHHGFVLAFALKPGRYDVALNSTLVFYSVPDTPIASFNVQAGKIVYLGEFFLTPSDVLNRVEYEIRDARARDLAFAIDQNPWLLDLDVIAAPLRLRAD